VNLTDKPLMISNVLREELFSIPKMVEVDG